MRRRYCQYFGSNGKCQTGDPCGNCECKYPSFKYIKRKQWYKSNSLITGATSQDYTFTAVGDYTVVVAQNGCSSDPSVISVMTGIVPLDNSKKISVYPNPVTNELIIESVENTKKIDFVIMSATGQVVYTGYLYEKVVIPTTGYATGLYFIKLRSGKIIEFRKIVKL